MKFSNRNKRNKKLAFTGAALTAVMAATAVTPVLAAGIETVPGKAVDMNKVSDSVARGVNPLHDVNNARQDLILDAIESKDWTEYYKFEAAQAPLHFGKDKDGKLVRNKNFYANLLSSAYDSMVEADIQAKSGKDEDKVQYEARKKHFDELIQDYNNAPGMSVYIARVNSRDDIAKDYGIQVPDKGFFDSIYNNYNARVKGYTEDKYWYENAYYKDKPELIKEIVGSLVEYGTISTLDSYDMLKAYESKRKEAKPDINHSEVVKSYESSLAAYEKAQSDLFELAKSYAGEQDLTDKTTQELLEIVKQYESQNPDAAGQHKADSAK